MITGDHPATARAIARALGMLGDGRQRASPGRELAQLSTTRARRARRRDARVYARVDPAQKIRIVEALQARGEFVAMTGDGVNDAPALKQRRHRRGDGQGRHRRRARGLGPGAARRQLRDDRRRGARGPAHLRQHPQVRRASSIAGNAGEIWTLFLAPFLGLPIPLLPIHILWVNLVTDGLPGLALASEPAERGVMRRPPRPPDESVFAHGLWQHIVWVGLLIGGVTLATQAWAIAHGRALADDGLHRADVRAAGARARDPVGDARACSRLGLGTNRFLLGTIGASVALHLAIVYVPVLQVVFGTESLSPPALLVATALSLVVFVGVEIEKWATRHGWLYDLRARNAHVS